MTCLLRAPAEMLRIRTGLVDRADLRAGDRHRA